MPFVPRGARRLILVSNEREVGEKMDLANDNMELRYHGYSKHDRCSIHFVGARQPVLETLLMLSRQR